MEEVVKNQNETEFKRDFKPIIIYLLTQVVLTFILAFLITLICQVKGYTFSENKLVYLITLIAGLANFAIMTLFYFKRLKLDFKRITKKAIIITLIGTIIVVAANEIICHIFEKFDVEMFNQDTVEGMYEQFPILTALFILTAAFAEEILFRYCIRTLIKNKVVYVIVSALVFGVLHGIGIATILYMVLGAIFAIVYLKTDENVALTSTMHLVNNIVGIIEIAL